MRHLLDIDQWARRTHFEFFSRFDEPYFGITVDVDCTATYQHARAGGHSFFLSYLHKALVAANLTEPFRYRILDGQVWVYDQVNASPTINRPDGTFGFGYMNYEEDFAVFEMNAMLEIERVRHSQGLEPAVSGENVIHFSTLPWISFTSLSHARSFLPQDSIPKISFGKVTDTPDGRKRMPVAVHVHHGLMDGYHVGLFLDHFQTLLEKG